VAETPEIKVKLTAEDTGVAAAIKELGNQLKNVKKSQDETAGSALSLKNAWGSLAAIAATIGLARFAKDAFDSAVNIGKMADKTGLSTQTLSVFHKVADDVGVSTDAVDKALIRGAKSITEFEAGTSKANLGFQILNLHQKEFAGLNADQKIALVTDRLGHLSAGFQKTTAAQLIFSRGGAEAIPVLNALAAQGFDKATEATARLGLLLDQTTTDTFRAAKASLQELGDAGKGAATQFEAGFLPAISDVGDALLGSIEIDGKAGDGIQELGKVAGNVVRYIAAGFIWMGVEIAAGITDVKIGFSEQFEEIRIKGGSVWQALTDAAKGHFSEAKAAIEQGTRDIKRAHEDAVAQQHAVDSDAFAHVGKAMQDLFPSPEEEAARAKARIAALRPDKTTEAGDITKAGTAAGAGTTDAAMKAAASLLQKQLQDELEIQRAHAKQSAQIDQEMYEKGEISLKEYFDRRRAEVSADAGTEAAILQKELEGAQAEIARATDAQQKAIVAMRNAKTPKDKAAATKEEDKSGAEALQALAKAGELQTKITGVQVDAATKVQALDSEEFKKKEENQKKLIEFQAQILDAEGRTYDAAVLRIKEEGRVMADELVKAGVAAADAQAQAQILIAQKTADAKFAEQEKITGQLQQQFEIEKKGIELQAGDRLITKAQEEKKINDLIKERLPILMKQAQAELAIAQASGNPEQIAKAQQTVQSLQNIQLKASQLATTVKGALKSDFQSFFSTLTSGTTSAGQAFANLGISVVRSLEQIAAQMLITFAVQKLMDMLGIESAPQKVAKAAATNDALIVSNAGAAGAAAFASVMEAVPFPANMAVAPAMMATAIGETMSNLALGSAAKGAVLPADMLIQAHAREMILPAEISTGLQDAIARGALARPQVVTPSSFLGARGAGSPEVGRAGGDQYFHDEFHLHHNGPDARQILERELVPMIQKARRGGHLGP
jgi:hypothetical protein